MIFEFIPDSNIQPHVSIPKRDFGATDMLMGITTGMTFQSLKGILVDFGKLKPQTKDSALVFQSLKGILVDFGLHRLWRYC